MFDSYENFLETTFNTSSQNISVKLTYNNGGVPASRGYLDYIILEAKRNLTGYGNQFIFQNLKKQSNIGIGQYTISNASVYFSSLGCFGSFIILKNTIIIKLIFHLKLI